MNQTTFLFLKSSILQFGVVLYLDSDITKNVRCVCTAGQSSAKWMLLATSIFLPAVTFQEGWREFTVDKKTFASCWTNWSRSEFNLVPQS